MNGFGSLRLAAVVLTVALGAAAARGQLAVNWYTIDGGGGTSSGGTFVVSGTIGQPDAGSMSGGIFVVNGGFWPGLAAVGPHCGSADFDCDGDVATDFDIQSFFACLAGDCPPPPCTSSADFNGDGDVATDADIEAFFRVLAGGNC